MILVTGCETTLDSSLEIGLATEESKSDCKEGSLAIDCDPIDESDLRWW